MIRLWSGRWLASLLLIVAPITLLIWQQVGGVFALRDGTADRAIFTLIMSLLVTGGFTIQETNPKEMFRNFILSLAVLVGLPLLISGILAVNDTINSTNVTAGLGFWYALDSISAQVSEWTVIVQVIVGLIPVAVIVIGVIMIYAADNPDEYGTAILETVIVIGIMVLAVLVFGWMGVSIF